MPVTLFTGMLAVAAPVQPPPVVTLQLGLLRVDVSEVDAGRQRNRAGIVVHVVALNAFVHDAVTAADNRLAVSLEVVGKTRDAAGNSATNCPRSLSARQRNRTARYR